MTADLDRAAVRARFETRFSVKRMAEDYVAIYAAMTSGITYDFATGTPRSDMNFASLSG